MAVIKQKRVSNVGYILPIESISRKFARREDTCAARVNNTGGPNYMIPQRSWIGAAAIERTIHGHGKVVKNVIVVRRFGRASLPKAAELTNRSNFTIATEWVRAAQKDLMAISTNQSRWFAAIEDFSKTIEGVSARGYQTMRGWMVAVAMAVKKAQTTLPADHILPNFDE